jgi:hypothetical protein
LKPAWALRAYLKKPITKNWAGGVAQGENPEFKPQYHTQKKNRNMLSWLPASTWAPSCSPLYFPSLSFSKPHLHLHVLQWSLPEGHEEFESLLITEALSNPPDQSSK